MNHSTTICFDLANLPMAKAFGNLILVLNMSGIPYKILQDFDNLGIAAPTVQVEIGEGY